MTKTQINHNGLTYLADPIETGTHGNRFRALQLIGKRGKPVAQHFLATLGDDGSIRTVARWF